MQGATWKQQRKKYLMSNNEDTDHVRELVKQVKSHDTVERIVKYLFLFWGVCVVAGTIVAVGLANAGMSPQDAFNSGLAVALLPFIAAGIIAAVLFFFIV